MNGALRRFVTAMVGVLLSTVLVFLLLRVLPGDIATARLGIDATPEALTNLRAEYGLDQPLASQYMKWILSAARGDLGRSLVTGDAVATDIVSRLDVTVPLVAASSLIAVLLALVLGRRAALRRRSISGVTTVVVTQLGLAIPTFVVGIGLITLFSVRLRWLPAGGFPSGGWQSPIDAVRSLVLPTAALSLTQTAILLRFARSEALNVISSDAFRTARSVGRTNDAALATANRMLLVPVLQVTALQIATLVTSAVVVESVFALPGLGSMIVRDIANRDITKVQSTLLVVICFVFLLRFVLETVNDRLDPRRVP